MRLTSSADGFFCRNSNVSLHKEHGSDAIFQRTRHHLNYMQYLSACNLAMAPPQANPKLKALTGIKLIKKTQWNHAGSSGSPTNRWAYKGLTYGLINRLHISQDSLGQIAQFALLELAKTVADHILTTHRNPNRRALPCAKPFHRHAQRKELSYRQHATMRLGPSLRCNPNPVCLQPSPRATSCFVSQSEPLTSW